MHIPTPLVAALCLAPAFSSAGEEKEPLRICLISGSKEYESDRTLPEFQKHLEERYNARCRFVRAVSDDRLPGLEALDDSDVALFFTRRLTISGEELERVKKYCEKGRPIVAVRTASHGFQNWLEFDKLVLGGNYQGHYGAGPTLETKVAAEAKDHPLLQGVGPLRSRASLYRAAPLAPDAQPLLTGTCPTCSEPQPVAWTRVHQGGRVFYTSLGAQGDFENASFRRLLANALFWTAGRRVEMKGAWPLSPLPARNAGLLKLHLRSRLETFKGSGAWDEVLVEKALPTAKTAIIICDMWDQHWCQGASKRCDELAAKMAPVIEAARSRGIQIIHAPSETMGFYADLPARRRMQEVPAVPPPKLLDVAEPPLPIDDSDGGCDTAEKPWYLAWTRQNPRLSIADEDALSDSGAEVYGFLRQAGIENLIVMGVHTNMCVLGRSFGIRQMTRMGIRCILVRDLTDTMYDPQDRPQVSHAEGTELVVQHIEKYWCPSITSSDLVGGLQ
jgi:type 1 glutamine amidotransferase/nicotinamidase-related amidase